MRIISSQSLQAPESKRQAWYAISLCELAEGWVVIKLSGATGSRGTREAWYRETEELARKKYDAIVKQKTGSRTGRQYRATIAQRNPFPVQSSFSW